MIGHIEGAVLAIRNTFAIISAGGIGYKIALTKEALAELKPGKTASLWTHLAVREDALDLYGFRNEEELRIFELLLTVSGIGPKSAMAILDIATVEYANKELSLMVRGYDTKLSDRGFADIDIKIGSGRYFSPREQGTVIIGYNIAHDKFDKDILVKNNININSKQFKVIGIFEKTGVDEDDSIYLPLEDARELFNKKDLVNVLVVKIKDGIDIEKAADDITRILKRTYNEEEFVVFTPEQVLNQLEEILNVVKVLLSGIAAISLVVGGIGIMNSMFTSVLERRRQIGIMKAVGATKNQILFAFLVESGLIGLGGGVIGVLLGFSVAKSVEIVAKLMGFGLLYITPDYKVMIPMLLFSFFVGMISGIIPAYQAAKLSPVEALRYE